MTAVEKRFYRSEKGYRLITRWYDSLLDKFTFPFTSEYVQTNFGETHYLAAGEIDAEPLIFVQAIAGSSPLWYHQIPFFAQYYRVYALDTPGQPGRSAPIPPPFLEDGYTEWLLDVLDALEIDRANFVGVSSGGWYVLRLAIAAPHRVKKLVMISPTGLVRARFPINILLKNVISKNKSEAQLEDELATRSFLPASGTDEFDRELARAMALSTRHYALEKTLGIYDEERSRYKLRDSFRLIRRLFFRESKKMLKKLSTPGLVVLGEHEMLYDAEKAAKKITRIQGLRTEIIPKTGHSAMYDQPELVNETILSFLQS